VISTVVEHLSRQVLVDRNTIRVKLIVRTILPVRQLGHVLSAHEDEVMSIGGADGVDDVAREGEIPAVGLRSADSISRAVSRLELVSELPSEQSATTGQALDDLTHPGLVLHLV